MPAEVRQTFLNLISKPLFLARLLKEQADSADEWAEAHADGTSWTIKNKIPIRKKDSYAEKALMLRKAADIFSSIGS